MNECSCTTRNVSGQRSVSGTRAFLINISSKIQDKRAQGKILKFFLLDTLKTIFGMENLTQRWTQSGPFCPKSGHFQFSKRAGEDSSLPLSCASVSMAEYAISLLNMNKYP